MFLHHFLLNTSLMKALSSCDVTSGNLVWRHIPHEQEVQDRERWVGEIEGCEQHGRVWAQLKETLVGT